MTGHAPDFGMLMVGANAGIVGMTKEHLGLALALRSVRGFSSIDSVFFNIKKVFHSSFLTFRALQL